MTRRSFVSRLTRYAIDCSCAKGPLNPSWPPQGAVGTHHVCCHAGGHEPSTSYAYGIQSTGFHSVARRPSCARGFCSWPLTAAATSQTQSQEGNSSANWVLDPASAAEYDRRLREFLNASRALQDLPTARRDPPAPPPPPRPNRPLPPPPFHSFIAPAAAATIPAQDNTGFLVGDVATAVAAVASESTGSPAAASPTSPVPSTTSPPPGISPASPLSPPSLQSSSRVGLGPPEVASSSSSALQATAAAATARDRARAALRNVPAFTPARIGGCSSNSSNPSGPPANGCGGAAAAAALPRSEVSAALPQPVPAAPVLPAPPAPPHPASPTPVDWRGLLQRARQVLGSRQVAGAEMLTDKFSRIHTYLRISLTERCNLRCTYCMPDEGVALTPTPQLLTSREIMRLARIFVEAGVTKIRLTGGEPTLRRDITDLIRQLSSLRPMGLRSVAITSNGIVLARQLPELKEAGLTAVNISLDTLRGERFEQLARRPGHKRVLESIRTAVGLGYDPVKVNVVVMRGVNDDEVADFAALTRDQPINVRFIEYMPFDGNVWSDSKMVPYRELISRIQAAFPYTPLERLDDPAGEVAKNFRLWGHRGSVSFITSMTQHFCSDCNRLRLLADGNLKVCLFGAAEVSLRDAMRGGASDDDLRAIITAAVGRKRAAHAGMFELAASANRPMITIGG